jgi:hypothetical protein
MLMFVTQLAVFVYRCIAFQQLKKKTFPNMVGLSAIATSVLFTAVAGVLVFFIKNGVESACEATVWACILLYMATKGQIGLFFVERMHIVHKSPSQTRLESPLYIFNMCLLFPASGLLVLVILYRISYIADDKHCRHGFGRESMIPGLIYDTSFSLYSLVVFVWPLFKSQSLHRSESLLWVVKKNIIGSAVSTVSTFLNLFTLFYREVHSAELCYLRCTADIMVNVMVMNFLISGRGGNRKTRQDHQSNYNSSALYTPNKSENDNVKSLRSSKVYPFGCPSVVCSTSEVNLAPTSVTELESGHSPTVTKEETVIEEIV